LLKAMGSTDVLRERLGQRDLPPFVLRAESIEEALNRAKASERPEMELVSSIGSFNIVRHASGYIAVAKSLGPTSLLKESLGERDLHPIVFSASTYEALCEKLVRSAGASFEAFVTDVRRELFVELNKITSILRQDIAQIRQDATSEINRVNDVVTSITD